MEPMEDPSPTRQPLEVDGPAEPATSVNVRRFLQSHGVKEHNHASEIARIINVDRSQSYRRLKGDVSWSHTDLRAVAHHFGAPDDFLLPRDDLARYAPHPGPEPVAAVIRVAHLPPTGLLVPGAELAAGESSDLVAIRNGSPDSFSQIARTASVSRRTSSAGPSSSTISTAPAPSG